MDSFTEPLGSINPGPTSPAAGHARPHKLFLDLPEQRESDPAKWL